MFSPSSNDQGWLSIPKTLAAFSQRFPDSCSGFISAGVVIAGLIILGLDCDFLKRQGAESTSALNRQGLKFTVLRVAVEATPVSGSKTSI